LLTAAIRGAVEVRLNWKGVPLATATIRLAFWKARATFVGRTAETMTSEKAVANSLTSA
jgi:hypothetical protein